jgi:hypothetical protein
MPSKKPKKKAFGSPKEKSVFLRNVWLMGDVCLQYADNLILRYQEGAFHLMFFQQQVPPLVGTPEEMAEQLMASGVMENNCVGRLVISKDKIPAMIEALQAAYDGIPASKEPPPKASGPNGAR